jgi:hypothetical protein
MPRFFFHVSDNSGVAIDDEGRELHSFDVAWKEAVKGARSIIGDEVSQGRIDLRGMIRIADEAGTVLAAIPFSDLVEIFLDPGS